jgi:hypothetical protein
MAEQPATNLETISKLVQVVSVVAGVAISVFSFNQARTNEAIARKLELEKRQIEASRPFLELRQKRYVEAVDAASVLASPETHGRQELEAARKRFLELYWGSLSMVEEAAVETKMMDMACSLDLVPCVREKLTPQAAVYHLSHAVRDSLLDSWGVAKEKAGEVNR